MQRCRQHAARHQRCPPHCERRTCVAHTGPNAFLKGVINSPGPTPGNIHQGSFDQELQDDGAPVCGPGSGCAQYEEDIQVLEEQDRKSKEKRDVVKAHQELQKYAMSQLTSMSEGGIPRDLNNINAAISSMLGVAGIATPAAPAAPASTGSRRLSRMPSKYDGRADSPVVNAMAVHNPEVATVPSIPFPQPRKKIVQIRARVPKKGKSNERKMPLYSIRPSSGDIVLEQDHFTVFSGSSKGDPSLLDASQIAELARNKTVSGIKIKKRGRPAKSGEGTSANREREAQLKLAEEQLEISQDQKERLQEKFAKFQSDAAGPLRRMRRGVKEWTKNGMATSDLIVQAEAQGDRDGPVPGVSPSELVPIRLEFTYNGERVSDYVLYDLCNLEDSDMGLTSASKISAEQFAYAWCLDMGLPDAESIVATLVRKQVAEYLSVNQLPIFDKVLRAQEVALRHIQDNQSDEDTEDEEPVHKRRRKLKFYASSSSEAEETSDPSTPKARGTTAYIMYVAEMRPVIQQANTTWTNQRVMQEVGTLWRDLPEIDRDRFVEKARERNEEKWRKDRERRERRRAKKKASEKFDGAVGDESSDAEPPADLPALDPVPNDYIFVIRIDLTIDGLSLFDQFEWDIMNPVNSPEEFAKILCADLGLPRAFEFATAHTIREQVQHYLQHLVGPKCNQYHHLKSFQRQEAVVDGLRRSEELPFWSPIMGPQPVISSARSAADAQDGAITTKSPYELFTRRARVARAGEKRV